MPALPWAKREEPEPGREYLVMASRLPLAHYRCVPGFIRYTMAVRRQLARTEGLVGYSLFADLVKKTFWTFSVWHDQDSLDRFARAEPHRSIMRALQPRMGKTRFKAFKLQGSQLTLSWDEMKDLVR